MNSKQRRKQRKKIGIDFKKPKDAEWYSKCKNDPRCIAARRKTRERIPEFKHCGSGGNGYIFLICDGCPEFETEKYT